MLTHIQQPAITVFSHLPRENIFWRLIRVRMIQKPKLGGKKILHVHFFFTLRISVFITTSPETHRTRKRQVGKVQHVVNATKSYSAMLFFKRIL